MQDSELINRLSDDYAKHKDSDIYTKYLNQLTTANLGTKGDTSMVCEGLFNLFGTTSEEVIAQAKQESKQELDAYYLPRINELSSSNEQLSSSNQILLTQNKYLQNLLKQNNIAFDLTSLLGETTMPNQ